MDSNGQGPSRNAGKPDWFLHWLKEVFLPASKDPVSSQVKKYEDVEERIPDIDDAVKASLTNALTTEARISFAHEDDKSKVSELIKTQLLPAQESSSPMPWNQLTEAETKSVAKALETLQQQDFSSKSLKHWTALFNDKFDRSLITSRVGKLALVYNSCSLSLKQRLISLDVGKQAQENSYTYLLLLQLITAVVHSPVSHDQAMLEIYKGFKQANGETVQTYLQRMRDLGEDARGPSSGWTMSQASLLLKKICDGFQSAELAKLTASIVITVLFQWNVLCDSILQFQQRVRTSHPEKNVNAIQREMKPLCFKCGGNHGIRDCKTLVCRYCGLDHQSQDCAKKGQRTFCVKCKSKSHNIEGHFKYAPDNQKPRRSDINLIEATSFLEGAISMDSNRTGNHFENTKILIDTGALIPTGVTISEYFFTNNLRGRMEDLEPSELSSANGASSNSTMETVGQLEVRIRFNNLSTIFSGLAVVLKNLSLPVIIGVNFLKTNSLSPILDPSSAQIVHKPTAEKQDLIANLGNSQNRSRPILRSPRKPVEKSPPLSESPLPPSKLCY